MWEKIEKEAQSIELKNTFMRDFIDEVLKEHTNFDDLICKVLSDLIEKSQPYAKKLELFVLYSELARSRPEVVKNIAKDLCWLTELNPACPNLLIGLLSFQGFQALAFYRFNHALFHSGKTELALLLQNWAAQITSIDIHPAAKIDAPVILDHGIGIVIGETTIIEKHVIIWHGVTLGSKLKNLKENTKRHPTIRQGAFIAAGASILGDTEIGENSFVGANSVVSKNVPPGDVVAGIPARSIKMRKENDDA